MDKKVPHPLFKLATELGPLLIFFFAYVAAIVYALVVWGMYKSMVHNFDMTIRKQSR